ncbi:MAG: acyl-CoA thioesterase [Chthoniobacterales bacterium]
MDLPKIYHFAHKRRVEFAETDMAGVVHFSNILRYVEAAEHAMRRACETSNYEIVGSQHLGWPRVEISCRYTKPIHFEEVIETCLHIDEIRSSGMRFRFWIFKNDERSSASVAAYGYMTSVYAAFDRDTNRLSKSVIPNAVRQALEKLQTRVCGHKGFG